MKVAPFVAPRLALVLALGAMACTGRIGGGTHDAIRDPNAPNEDVAIKHDTAFSENFDIVASTGCARTWPSVFTSTCAPNGW